MIQDINNMKNFLYKATQIESKKYALETLLNTIDNEYQRLGTIEFYCDSREAVKNARLLENLSKYSGSRASQLTGADIIIRCLIGLMLVPPVMFGALAIIALVLGYVDIFSDGGIIILLCFAAVFVIVFFVLKSRKKRVKNEYKGKKAWHIQMLQKAAEDKKDNQKVREYLLTEASEVQKRINSIDIVRRNHYATNPGFAHEYWNLTAVATMYGFIQRGQCDKVIGHGGIIDTYENYLRDRIIIGNLVEINQLMREANNKLSQILQNQETLICEVRRGNDIAEKAYSSIRNIESNVRSINYNQERLCRQVDMWNV